MSQDKPVLVEGWGMGPDGDKDVLAFINDTPLLLSLLYDLDLLPEQHPDHESPAWDKIFTITNHWREAALERQGSGWIKVTDRSPTVEDGIVAIADADGQLGYAYCETNKELILASEGTGPAVEWYPLPPSPQAQDAQTGEKKSHEFVDCYVEHNPQHGYYIANEPPQAGQGDQTSQGLSPVGPASGSPDGEKK